MLVRESAACGLSRNSRGSGARRKKTATAVHQEIARELDLLLPRIFAEQRRAGQLDIEAVELAFRTALHCAGAVGLTELLRQPGPVQTSVPCACGSQARYKDMRLKPILTVLGPAKMLRAYYWCSRCRQGQFPADIARDIADTEYSPGVRRMDGTGLPMVAKETEGRSGKGAEGRAHTREVKPGCLFTQTTTDDQGRPVRDDGSATYTGAIETAAEFSRRIYTEAHQRGWGRAQIKVVMGDGADWIWNISEEQFPGAIQIVDLYHARQHLWDLGGKLHPNDEKSKRRWVMAHQHFLDDGKIEKLVAKLRSLSPDNPELAAAVRTEANYFERNAERMRYPKFRKQNLFVGSGIIEAGCKTVMGSRLKRPGMFWTVRGANAVIALRCCRHSRQFDDYWEHRRG